MPCPRPASIIEFAAQGRGRAVFPRPRSRTKPPGAVMSRVWPERRSSARSKSTRRNPQSGNSPALSLSLSSLPPTRRPAQVGARMPAPGVPRRPKGFCDVIRRAGNRVRYLLGLSVPWPQQMIGVSNAGRLAQPGADVEPIHSRQHDNQENQIPSARLSQFRARRHTSAARRGFVSPCRRRAIKKRVTNPRRPPTVSAGLELERRALGFDYSWMSCLPAWMGSTSAAGLAARRFERHHPADGHGTRGRRGRRLDAAPTITSQTL